MGTFTINLGERQTGRVKAKNVFDIKFKTRDIYKNQLYFKKKKAKVL